MMDTPSQARLQKGQIMLLDDRLDEAKRFKGSIFEISLPVILAYLVSDVAVSAFLGYVLGLVFSREETTG